MQKVPTQFTEGHSTYAQQERCGQVAIYTQTSRHSGHVYYEVVILRVYPACTWPDGRTSPHRESYPPASAWGTRGWTFATYEAAQGKYTALLAEQEAQ